MTKDEALKLAREVLEANDEALKLALEALDCICSPLHVREIEKIGSAMKAIREALAQPEFVLNGIDCSCGRKWRVVNNTLTASEQPEQEPVAIDWERIARVQDAKLLAMCNEAGGFEKLREVMDKYKETTPPQRTWVGLTDEDKNDCLVSADPCECLAKPESHQLMEDVEAKLREKNSC